MDVYCCLCDGELAAGLTTLGTPLSQGCMAAYKAGQAAPDAGVQLLDDFDLPDGCEDPTCAFCPASAMWAASQGGDGSPLTFLCFTCGDAWCMGVALPAEPVYTIENVRFDRSDRGVYTITAIFDGADWQPVANASAA